MDRDKRTQMLAQWLSGESSPEAETELLDQLRDDAQFRKQASKHLIIHRLMEQQLIPEGDFAGQVMEMINSDHSDSSFVDGAMTKLKDCRRRRTRMMMTWIGGAVAAAAVLVVIFWPNSPPMPVGSGVRVAAAEGIGTLNLEKLERGETIELRTGILELELNPEARVVLEAPATFNVISPEHIRLAHGRCFAEMEKGSSGLRIETPSGEVLDLGTSFAVEVPSSSTMNVHVFDGEVEVSDQKGKVRLKEGQGLIQTDPGEHRSVAAQPGNFVPQVPRSVQIRGLHWSFDEGKGGNVAVRSTDGLDPIGDGRLEDNISDTDGPEFVPGKFGTALEFNGAGQWVRTNHPGIKGNANRTLACWIKLPDDWGEGDRRAPMVSWGLKGQGVEDQAWLFGINGVLKRDQKMTGRLRLGVGKQSTSGVTDLRDGAWHHVAAVALNNLTEPTILFYVDGQLEHVSRGEIQSVETETAEDRSQSVRFGRRVSSNKLYLRGTLDEVYILEGALSGDQVRALMRNELAKSFTR